MARPGQFRRHRGRQPDAALRNRHIPVHTVGFGRDHLSRDVEIDDALVARAANSRNRGLAPVVPISSARLRQPEGRAERSATGERRWLPGRSPSRLMTTSPRSRDLHCSTPAVQGVAVLRRYAARGRERREQHRHAPGQRRRREAARAVSRRRAALGVQIHQARGGRGPHGVAGPDAAYHREQDLSAERARSPGARARLSDAARGAVRLSRADHRFHRSHLLHPGSARADPRLRGSPRRRSAAARRPVLAGRRRLGRLQSGGCFRSSSPTPRTPFTSIRRRSN